MQHITGNHKDVEGIEEKVWNETVRIWVVKMSNILFIFT